MNYEARGKNINAREAKGKKWVQVQLGHKVEGGVGRERNGVVYVRYLKLENSMYILLACKKMWCCSSSLQVNSLWHSRRLRPERSVW